MRDDHGLLHNPLYATVEDRKIYIEALKGGVIRIDNSPTLRSSCRASDVVPPKPDESASQVPRRDFAVAEVTLGEQRYQMALADTASKRASGMSGWTGEDLEGIDGMLYVFSSPQAFDGYTFSPEVLFFDDTGRLIVSIPAQTCPSSNYQVCTRYYAKDNEGDPVPYQYVLEVAQGHLPPQPGGVTLHISDS
jgi:uncharacterized membrane protein (UPF0127 family)